MYQKNEKLPLKRISHIGIAVHSIDDALSFYRDTLGLSLEKIETVSSEKVRVAFLPIGETRIELIEPTDASSTVHKFLKKRGEGIHHIALETDHIYEHLAYLQSENVKLIHDQPKDGAGETKVAFIHPKEANSVLIELVDETKKGDL